MDQTPTKTALLTIKQAASSLSLSERTLWRMIANEEIKSVRFSLRRRAIPQSEIDRIVSEAA